MKPRRMSTAVGWFVAKAAISAAFLYFVLHRIDLRSISDDLRSLRPFWVCMALLQLCLIPALGGARWKLVLQALGLSFKFVSATRLFWIAMVFNQMLPSVSGGDAIRTFLAWRAGLPLEKSIHSVILERIAVLLTLVALAVGMQLWRGEPLPVTSAHTWLPVLLLLGLLGFVALLCADRIALLLPAWPPLTMISRLSVDARRVFLTPCGLWLLLLSLATHLNFSLASLWIGKSLGLPLGLPEYVYLVAIVTLITTLPVSIGGWGVREGATVVLFGGIGVLAHSALSFSVLSGIGVAVVSLAGLPFLVTAKSSGALAPTMGETAHVPII